MITGDMPAQSDNAGFLRHNATRGCRLCNCTQDERRDPEFDISARSRHHFNIVYDREYANTELAGGALKAFLSERGMRQEQPPMMKLAPTLDLIHGLGLDAPHSEWRRLRRILQGLLFNIILTKKIGSTSYLKAFQSFQYPPSWPHIQSPLLYIWSWSLSKAGRATILAPLILRSCAKPT